MGKKALPTNSFSKGERPRTGRIKSSSGFGRGTFGTARFGQRSGYEQPKEELPDNSHTKEGLS